MQVKVLDLLSVKYADNIDVVDIGKFSEADLSFISLAVRLDNYKKHIGVSKTKGRHDVSGGGRKPHAQKGTGRARHGSIRSPLWRGGATIFGGFKLSKCNAISYSKNERRHSFLSAMRFILSDQNDVVEYKLSDGYNVAVVNDFEYSLNKTEFAVKSFKEKFQDGCLIVFHDEFSFDFIKKVGNFPFVRFAHVDFLSVFDLLKCKNILFTRGSFELLIGRVSCLL